MVAGNSPVPIITIPSSAFDAANERLGELEKIFGVNAIINMLDGLAAEIESMPLASRFSTEGKIYASVDGPPDDINPLLKNMTEAEYKRWQLTHDMSKIRTSIIHLGGIFRLGFLDMQAAAAE